MDDKTTNMLLLFFTENICDQMEMKEPLELDINKNVFASGVIKLLFDINVTNFIFKLHRKKIFISETKINFLNIMVLEALLLLFNIKIYYQMKGIIAYYWTQNESIGNVNVIIIGKYIRFHCNEHR